MWSYISRSTLKREAAAVVMLWLISISTYLIIVAETFEQKFQIISLFAWPILGLYAGAFSLDWVSKQTTIAGPTMSDPAPRPSGSIDPPSDPPVIKSSVVLDTDAGQIKSETTIKKEGEP
jgi:hypothetical protein